MGSVRFRTQISPGWTANTKYKNVHYFYYLCSTLVRKRKSLLINSFIQFSIKMKMLILVLIFFNTLHFTKFVLPIDLHKIVFTFNLHFMQKGSCWRWSIDTMIIFFYFNIFASLFIRIWFFFFCYTVDNKFISENVDWILYICTFIKKWRILYDFY